MQSAFLKSVAWIIALAVLASVFLAPTMPGAEAEARTTVTVQIAYGGLLVGGVGFFVYYSHTLGLGRLPAPPQPALLNIRAGTVKWGMPAPRLDFRENLLEPGGSSDNVELRLLEYRF